MKLLLLASTVAAALTIPASANAQWWNDDYNYGWPANPNNPNFDPAAASINSLNQQYGHRRYHNYSSPIDFSLIDQMERGDYSAFDRKTRCQVRYVTYNPATGLFIGNDGRPRRCKL